ncbi:FecR family protein [Mucilaginibacter sp. L196]|uniref:FecR family protein n=1 Tax=Mucilaginibacter sp. L196 TaxID=1641870 RepID=UPI00131E97B5|nr:FecR family protein [Mucilaginibacter sp. L196]
MSPKELIRKYLDGTATEEEKAVVESWYNQHRLENGHILSAEEQTEDVKAMDLHVLNPQKKALIWPRLSAAASILIIFGLLGYFFVYHPNHLKTAQNNYKNDIAPGSNKATLSMGNGQTIVLNSSKNRMISNRANILINLQNGQLIYHNSSTDIENQTFKYDTLTVPRGGTYHLTLADGSKVWLNSASAIRFPETFSGNNRSVELLYGEAYLEVIHNDQKPFQVLAHAQLIQDVGTHFNVNTYTDEPFAKTTLLEGGIKVFVNRQTAMLEPGEQVQINNANALSVVSHIDPNEVIAWKNGQFIFSGQSIQSIMRDISRWYNVDVIYKGTPTRNDYIGSFSRYKNVSEVLKVLELTKTVHFKIEGRTITVMP